MAATLSQQQQLAPRLVALAGAARLGSDQAAVVLLRRAVDDAPSARRCAGGGGAGLSLRPERDRERGRRPRRGRAP